MKVEDFLKKRTHLILHGLFEVEETLPFAVKLLLRDTVVEQHTAVHLSEHVIVNTVYNCTLSEHVIINTVYNCTLSEHVIVNTVYNCTLSEYVIVNTVYNCTLSEYAIVNTVYNCTPE